LIKVKIFFEYKTNIRIYLTKFMKIEKKKL